MTIGITSSVNVKNKSNNDDLLKKKDVKIINCKLNKLEESVMYTANKIY